MPDLRLVIFDVDGTLVDSQNMIVAAMAAAFDAAALPLPDRAALLSIVGLSLPEAMLRLVPDADAPLVETMVEGYKSAYFQLRQTLGTIESSPLFDGIAEVLAALAAEPWTLLAVATGKSRRGLDKLIEGHGWQGLFVSGQTADDHPSKPNPAMILQILRETGVSADRAVMIGDTSYDMDMARAAGVRSIAVTWGYHSRDVLHADLYATTPADLTDAIDTLLEPSR